ncbi:thioredoxin-like 4, chloroplastic [Coffea eugenioides]|uniref:thioredoxin-like 4, chloroplastic n=1 Tax=Coffea eugenioides TaxID=49369 RepID=UPI000F5C95A3|nr:thioredoxin-like 4, chloroplastic isoform X1 [Coffea arabica]XP_027149151.1 thioredoxin-like 4, chloroplastic [Coffea eugenioides]
MQKLGVFCQAVSSSSGGQPHRHLIRAIQIVSNPLLERKIAELCPMNPRFSCRHTDLVLSTPNSTIRSIKTKAATSENDEELSDEDDELCPVDCVKEFQTNEEFFQILEKAEKTNTLVVVDFYRTSCGSCKYIEQGFAKLCKGSGDQEAPVIFLKHNVINEYDEESEVAERLRIRSVPLFHFYKNGTLLEAFATRDKERILAAILKYTSAPSEDALANLGRL